MSPLSELVWSPDEGLSIKIAASSLSTRKASLRWNADTLSIVISSPQHSGAGGKSADNIDANLVASEKMPSQLPTRSDSSVRVTAASTNRITNLEALQSTSMRSHEHDSKCHEGVNITNEGKEGSENCRMDKLEVMEAGSTSRNEAMPSISENQVDGRDKRSWATNAWHARLMEAVRQKDSALPKTTDNTLSPSSLGKLCGRGKARGELAGFLGSTKAQCPLNVNKEISNSLAFHSHDNHKGQFLQESHKDEPVVARGGPASGVNAVARCESASFINARKLEKGKEKVMYNSSNGITNTKESDDRNESIESCPSTKVPKRKHVEHSDVKLFSGNKRCRKEDNESSCSGLLQKCGSSFFNWMSSLTNGLIMLDQRAPAIPLDQKFSATTGEESAAPPLPLENNSGTPLQSVGFNSLFQSLYSHNVMITSKNISCQPESNSVLDKRIEMGRETLYVATETLASDSFQMVSGGNRRNFHNQLGILPMRAENNAGKFCSQEEKHSEHPAGCSNAAPVNKGGFSESLWVSRLLPKTSMKWMDVTPGNVERDYCAVNPKDVNGELHRTSPLNFNFEKELNDMQYITGKGSSHRATSSKCPAMPPEEPKQSETMASMFAKRLDALRHAKTNSVQLGQLAITCDHGLPKCRNRRRSAFVVSYNGHNELEEEQQANKSSSGNGRIVLWMGDKGKNQLCPGSSEELRRMLLSQSEHQHGGGCTSGKCVAPHNNLEANTSAEDIDTRHIEIKEGVSDFLSTLPDNKQIVPYGITSNDLCDESSVVFKAVCRLRLSRSDIIRWLRSPIMHTTLDGFFVRLRFGKWEEALGGTGYHVARLNGALDRNRLSVTIRNSTCQVDSRFVSNHDFHEDELKAWWSAAVKGHWKLPSKEELNTKLRERELLHS